MLKDEFLRMMKQDLVTSDDKMLKGLLECFEDVLSSVGSDFDIDPKKTVKVCYQSMYDYANKHKVNGGYVFALSEAKDFVKNYLGIKENTISIIRLEDFV